LSGGEDEAPNNLLPTALLLLGDLFRGGRRQLGSGRVAGASLPALGSRRPLPVEGQFGEL